MKRLISYAACCFSLLLLVGIHACKPDLSHPEPDPFVPEPIEEVENDEHAILAKTLNLPEQAYDYGSSFEPPHTEFRIRSSFSYDVATLGRVLFYDKNLSADGTVSCASCHIQANAFSDTVALSQGAHGNHTDRNSFALGVFISANNYYSRRDDTVQTKLFWDNRADDLAAQIRETLANPNEMDMDPAKLNEHLRQFEYYEPLIRRAYDRYPDPPFDAHIIDALSTFVLTMSSQQSWFDIGYMQMRNASYKQNFPNFTPSENRGKNLFLANCASCHGQFLGFQIDELFTEVEGTTACNGLDASYTDKGAGKVLNDPARDGHFKIPSLRNIAVTAPYMHDGRFKTLREVMEFYNDDIKAHENLHPLLRDEEGNPKRMNLSEDDIQDMIHFFHTLTDKQLLTSPKWSDPFK